MDNYTYLAEFKHGSASGEVQATSLKDAKARVTAMYKGQLRDVGVDKEGTPVFEATVITNITVNPIKE